MYSRTPLCTFAKKNANKWPIFDEQRVCPALLQRRMLTLPETQLGSYSSLRSFPNFRVESRNSLGPRPFPRMRKNLKRGRRKGGRWNVSVGVFRDNETSREDAVRASVCGMQQAAFPISQ